MNYQFKKFEGRNERFEDRITITKSYSIGFPTRFYNDNNVKNFKYAVLFWDEKNRAIGVGLTNNEEEKNKFSIMHNSTGYGGGVVARSFFRSLGIDPKKYYGRYDWEKNDVDGFGKIFVIKLKERND